MVTVRASVCAALLLLAGCSHPDTKTLDELPAEHRLAFEPGEAFDPLPVPAFGDWLQQHPEKGQTFEQFVRSNSLRPDGERTRIYLQPLGSFGPDAPALGLLQRFAEAFFAMEVVVLPASRFEDGPPVKTRLIWEGERRQFLTGDILARLRNQIPKDAYALLGVTMEDIYPGPDYYFVFGMATLRHRVGIYSFARYDPAFYEEPRPESWRRLALERSCKVLAHETGHLFGIRHCTAFRCVMNGANHLPEADAQPLHLCPVDLRKLHHSVGFDPVERYRRLLAFTEEVGFLDEEVWLRLRIGSLTAPDAID